jgi:NAD(P)H-dependent flavin oxidoreductase YrpB (nitropropane dioxygenase family)
VEEWNGKREEARRERDRLRGQIVSTTQAGRQHECVLWAGQTAGGIKEVLPVATIMRRIIEETEAALLRALTFVRTSSQQAAE